MRQLARHLEKVRAAHPGRKLAVLFDIDGTIFDARFMILFSLRAYDREKGTRYFERLALEDLTVAETKLDSVLTRCGVPTYELPKIRQWWMGTSWEIDAILEAQLPFRGVMEVIRWLQLQPDVAVGLNTGRSERLRDVTLRTLSRLGRRHRVVFADEMLFMRDTRSSIEDAKAQGVHYFEALGFVVAAMVDNEPVNLLRLADSLPDRDLLLLHADTVFDSPADLVPSGAARGRSYDPAPLIESAGLPRHVHLVWRDVWGDSLTAFMNSNVEWGRVHAHTDIWTGEPVLGRRPDLVYGGAPAGRPEPLRVLARLFAEAGRSLRVEVDGNARLAERVCSTLAGSGLPAERVALGGGLYPLRHSGFRVLNERYPGSPIHCPIDELAPFAAALPLRCKSIIDELAGWGISRFSLHWSTRGKRRLSAQLAEWGHQVDIRGVESLDAYYQAVLLAPHSIVCTPGLTVGCRWNGVSVGGIPVQPPPARTTS